MSLEKFDEEIPLEGTARDLLLDKLKRKYAHTAEWSEEKYFEKVEAEGRYSLFSVEDGQATNLVDCPMTLLRAVDITRRTHDIHYIAEFLEAGNPLSKNGSIIVADALRNHATSGDGAPIYEVPLQVWRLEKAVETLLREAPPHRRRHEDEIQKVATKIGIGFEELNKYVNKGKTGQQGRERAKIKTFRAAP